MATVYLDDALYRRLQASAEARGSSVESELRSLIEERLSSSADDDEAEHRQSRMVERLRSLAIDPGPDYPGAVEYVRRMREDDDAALDRAVRGGT